VDSAPGPGLDGSAPPDASDASDAGTDAAALACGAWTPYVAFDASGWDGAALGVNSFDGSALPGPAPASCGQSFTPALIQVFNDAPCSIDLWYVDPVCEEDYFFTIPPGELGHVHSYSGTTWRLRASGTGELLQEVAPLPNAEDDASVAPATFFTYPPSDAGLLDAAALPPALEVNPDAAACVGWNPVIEYDAGAWDGAPSPLADDAGTLPGPPPWVCSIDGDNPVELLFVDDTDCPIDVYWVDYQCHEEFWETLENGRTTSAGTYATTVWRFRDHGSNALLAQAPVVPESWDGGSVVFRYP
jgi:hypothetical protein